MAIEKPEYNSRLGEINPGRNTGVNCLRVCENVTRPGEKKIYDEYESYQVRENITRDEMMIQGG